MHNNISMAILCGGSFMQPLLARADDLSCMPATLCIDDACQTGHDARLVMTLRNWTSAHPVLGSDYGKVTMNRTKGDAPMQWAGVNYQGQTETLTVRPADMTFVHVVQMEATSAVAKITAKGQCEVRK